MLFSFPAETPAFDALLLQSGRVHPVVDICICIHTVGYFGGAVGAVPVVRSVDGITGDVAPVIAGIGIDINVGWRFSFVQIKIVGLCLGQPGDLPLAVVLIGIIRDIGNAAFSRIVIMGTGLCALDWPSISIQLIGKRGYL